MTSRPPHPPTRPAARDVSRRAFLAAIAAGGAAIGLAGCTVISGGAVAADQQGIRLSKDPAPGRAHVVEMYNIWGGTLGNAWVLLAELYEQSQSHTGVRVTYAPLSGNTQIRLQTAIAAGTPPDLAFCTPEEYPQFAGYGVVTRLDGYMRKAGLTEQDYAPAVWKQMTATDGIWAHPVLVDVNFPLFWNKLVFADAGLDPEAPPKTIDELDRFSDAILKKDGRRVTRIGTIPWDYYGFSNSMFTLGFAFGGKFMSDDNQVATPDDDNIVQGLQWMCDYAKKVGGASQLAVTAPSQTLPSIASGNVGMAPMTTTDSSNVFKQGDKAKVELGAALFPYAEGLGKPGGATWLGGYDLFIPKESTEHDAAWDFLQFATTSDAGTEANFENATLLPGYTESPVLDEFRKDPTVAVYREGLLAARNIRPTIPVASTYATALDVAVSSAIYGQTTPERALKSVAAQVNSALDEFRKEHP
ncbi:extracellular solute-binding protein [Curtobacterium sp. MCPF17_002]|uniref:extracellular solute-binding protein n=1 Tax=Curtobacterium sp. MCPF17_002 TaxID=2175645 RepID=UPI000DAAB793|nr:extracellular solute-binding protein [Curtobacterium sp. MCPF17_002]WIB76654.1 extracellular solute-binding protein [Curtobacterium sp. MCPF17_002]